MIYLLYAVLLLVGACVLAVFASTLLFRPRASDTPTLLTEEENFDKYGAVSALQQMVRCKTVSYQDPALEDDTEFQKLIGKLPGLYPNVFRGPRSGCVNSISSGVSGSGVSQQDYSSVI